MISKNFVFAKFRTSLKRAFQFTLLILMSLCLFKMQARASDWSFFPQKTEAQKELLKAIQSGSYSQALLFWDSSLAKTSFKNSTTGKAFHSWLLFSSGAPTLGTARLLSLKAPHHINKNVQGLWRSSLSTVATNLSLDDNSVTTQWKNFLGDELYQILQTKPVYSSDNPKTISRLSKLAADRSTANSLRPWYQWQLALAAAHQDKNDLADNQIARLLETKQKVVDKNALYLTKARIAYQQNQFDLAIDWYRRISKTSEHWLTAKEEMAWAYLRNDQPNKAKSEIYTVLSPIFASISGPESDFLSAFASLMICDYQNIFTVTKNFKTRHRQKIIALESLNKSMDSEVFQKFISTVDAKPLVLASFSKMLTEVPRNFIHDSFLMDHMRLRAAMVRESQAMAKINTDLTQRLAQSSSQRAEESKKQAYLRLRKLAQIELKEFKTMISKLHIVEAEVIQRLHLDENRLGRRDKLSNPVPRSSDLISFPVTQEVWLDEVDNYHAEVKDCPKITRASL